jgi:hypothetical protein
MSNAVFVAWRSGGDSTGHWGPVGRLDRIPSGYRFVYTEGARALEGFHPFPGLDDLEAVYESSELFPLFANRLLAPSRPEYQKFLEWNGFRPDSHPDPIALLSISEGRRATDQLEILPFPLLDGEGCYRTKFFLHGLRWSSPGAIERVNRLQPEDQLGLMLDINNPVDPNAVAVRTMDPAENYLLGYVPRYLAGDVRSLSLSSSAGTTHLVVERVNKNAPLQFLLLCRLRACWPSGFVPCNEPNYQAIPKMVSIG